jgi:dehydrogenase/reductase SDR family protein 7B
MKHGRFVQTVAWVTGASSGIGRALALELDRQGAQVILSGRDVQRLEAVRRACARADGVILPFDLSDLEALPAVAERALASHGRIDLMVHNAGVAHRGLVTDTTMDVHQYIMATNYFGPVALTRSLLPPMLARGSGRFLVVSSLSGKFGGPCMSAYAASKHALHGFFESLRAEVHGRHVGVTIAIPGFVQTDITRHALTGGGSAYGKMLSSYRRAMPPERCARRILRATAAGRREVLVGGVEVWSVYLKRLSPAGVAWLMRSHPVRFQRKVKRMLGLDRGTAGSDE